MGPAPDNWWLQHFSRPAIAAWALVSLAWMGCCLLLLYRLLAGTLSGWWVLGALGCWCTASLCSAVPAGYLLSRR